MTEYFINLIQRGLFYLVRRLPYRRGARSRSTDKLLCVDHMGGVEWYLHFERGDLKTC